MSITYDSPKQFGKVIKKLPFKEVFLGKIKGYPGHRVDDIASEFDLLDDESEQWLYFGPNSFIKSYSTGTLIPYTKAIRDGECTQAIWFAVCNAMRELFLENLNSTGDTIILNLTATLNLVRSARYRIEEKIRESFLTELDQTKAFAEYDVTSLNKAISGSLADRVAGSNLVSLEKIDKLLTFLSNQTKWIRDYRISKNLAEPFRERSLFKNVAIIFTSNIFSQLRGLPQFANASVEDKLLYIYDLIGPILEGIARYSMNSNFIYTCPQTAKGLATCFVQSSESHNHVIVPPVWLGYNIATNTNNVLHPSSAIIELMWHNKERFNLKEVDTGCKTIQDVFSY